METDEIGGNMFLLFIGNIFTNIGKKLVDKGTKTTISNPACRLLNPFTLIINFTVNNNSKYQLLLQGDYKEKYKLHQDNESPISTEEMFDLVKGHKQLWYLKD